MSAVAFRLFFDPNDFRDKIESAVYESTGRELTIEGDVGLQFFPWLAVEIGRTRLGNAPGYGDEAFAEFESAQLSVLVMPLLFGQELTIGTVAIDGFSLDLRVDKQGRRNWSDFLSGDAPAAVSSEPPTGVTAAIDPATGRVLWSTTDHAVHSGCTISGNRASGPGVVGNFRRRHQQRID